MKQITSKDYRNAKIKQILTRLFFLILLGFVLYTIIF
jgi:hypothetical protein